MKDGVLSVKDADLLRTIMEWARSLPTSNLQDSLESVGATPHSGVLPQLYEYEYIKIARLMLLGQGARDCDVDTIAKVVEVAEAALAEHALRGHGQPGQPPHARPLDWGSEMQDKAGFLLWPKT